MTLSNLIRKRHTDNSATAISAISATGKSESMLAIARIATIAIANIKEGQTTPPTKVGAGDTATASRWWLIHYHERDPVKVVCFPEATHTEILERHPDATTAEPFIPIIRQATTPLSAEAESAIRAWLALIEETDLAIIAEVIRQCQQDADARHYFNGRAAFSV